MTTFDQRVRDALTIFDAHWSQTQPRLSDQLRETVGTIMACYAMQLELIEREAKQPITVCRGRRLATAAAYMGVKRRWFGLEPDRWLRRRLLAVIKGVKR